MFEQAQEYLETGELPQTEPKQEEVKKAEPESIEETIAKSIEEIKATQEPTEEVEEKVEEVKEQEPIKAQEEQATKGKSKQAKDSYQPPSDWTAEAKEEFRRLPKTAQKEIARVASQYEKYRKQTINEFSEKEKTLLAKEKEIDSIRTTISRFIPIWGKQGLTPEAALTEIATFYADLLKDPDAALEDVAKKVGRKIQIEGRKQQKNPDPMLQELLSRVQNIENSTVSSRQNAQLEQAQQLVGSIDQAFVSLKEQTNSQDRYIYPDLHREDFVKNDLEPLVIGLARANPNLSWQENIKRSYIAAGGRVIPNASPTTTKLNGVNRAAQRAATSLAGLGSSSDSELVPFIPGESVEDTVRRTVAALRSR